MLFQICNFLLKDFQLGITVYASILMIMRWLVLKNILIFSFKAIEISPHQLVKFIFLHEFLLQSLAQLFKLFNCGVKLR